jgi:rSAM/selenodomain-associated transferase 2
MKVSVIIPVLNEAANIARLIERLQENSNTSPEEILVVDGGSTDATLQKAQAAGAVVLLSPERGRAQQMNYGARIATGDLFYFVHADTLPPVSYLDDIAQAVQEGFSIGCFRTHFESHDLRLKINSYMTRFRFLWCRGGDQTLFVTRPLFEELGGYCPEHLIMEEFYFIRTAQKRYPFKIIPKEVLVSARKYAANGYFRVQIANLIVFNMFRFGFPPRQLVAAYRRLLS